MGMLDRYRKTGGFNQLLALLETCGPTKQEKFLEIINKEDATWATTIKQKMLDINRIYSWNDEVLAEVIGTLQDLTLAVCLKAGDDAFRERIYGMLTHGRRRKIDDVYDGKTPTPAEVAATHTRVIETVRKMIQDGYVRLEKFDPDLIVEDNIEEKLAKVNALGDAVGFSAPELSVVPPTSESSSSGSGGDSGELESRIMEINALRKKLQELSKENAVLRHELTLAKSKLDQIRKIA